MRKSAKKHIHQAVASLVRYDSKQNRSVSFMKNFAFQKNVITLHYKTGI